MPFRATEVAGVDQEEYPRYHDIEKPMEPATGMAERRGRE